MSRQYRMAIIGIGGIATMHAMAIGDLPNATLVAGSCRTEAKGRAFAQKFGCRWYAQYEEMLDRERPEVVTIATPSGAHLEPALACARRGIHVICEKPLEITTERIDRMIEAFATGGVMLGGIFQSRFNPVVRLVRQAAAEGRFGKLAVGAAFVPWWRDDAYYAPTRWQGTLALDGGGALMNQSIHNVDALQWIVGAAPEFKSLGPRESPVAEVFAYTGKLSHAEELIEVEDTAAVVLRFRSGALGQLLGATSMYPGSDRRLWIAGRDGTAEVVEETLATFAFREQRPQDAQALTDHAGKAKATGASDPLAISYAGHTRNIGAFLESLDTGSPLAIDGLEARKAVAILEAVYESARTGQAVKVR